MRELQEENSLLRGQVAEMEKALQMASDYHSATQEAHKVSSQQQQQQLGQQEQQQAGLGLGHRGKPCQQLTCQTCWAAHIWKCLSSLIVHASLRASEYTAPARAPGLVQRPSKGLISCTFACKGVRTKELTHNCCLCDVLLCVSGASGAGPCPCDC